MMGNLVTFLLFALGLVMIIKGSDWLIDGVIWFSKVFRIPQIIIGATIVSICTTLPETFVSVTAALKGQTDFAFGNVIGSIAVNTGFIFGLILIFAKPVIENRSTFIKNGFLLLILVVFLFIISLTVGEINRLIGILLLVLLVAYLIWNAISAKKAMTPGLSYEIESEEEMETEEGGGGGGGGGCLFTRASILMWKKRSWRSPARLSSNIALILLSGSPWSSSAPIFWSITALLSPRSSMSRRS